MRPLFYSPHRGDDLPAAISGFVLALVVAFSSRIGYEYTGLTIILVFALMGSRILARGAWIRRENGFWMFKAPLMKVKGYKDEEIRHIDVSNAYGSTRLLVEYERNGSKSVDTLGYIPLNLNLFLSDLREENPGRLSDGAKRYLARQVELETSKSATFPGIIAILSAFWIGFIALNRMTLHVLDNNFLMIPFSTPLFLPFLFLLALETRYRAIRWVRPREAFASIILALTVFLVLPQMTIGITTLHTPGGFYGGLLALILMNLVAGIRCFAATGPIGTAVLLLIGGLALPFVRDSMAVYHSISMERTVGIERRLPLQWGIREMNSPLLYSIELDKNNNLWGEVFTTEGEEISSTLLQERYSEFLPEMALPATSYTMLNENAWVKANINSITLLYSGTALEPVEIWRGTGEYAPAIVPSPEGQEFVWIQDSTLHAYSRQEREVHLLSDQVQKILGWQNDETILFVRTNGSVSEVDMEGELARVSLPEANWQYCIPWNQSMLFWGATEEGWVCAQPDRQLETVVRYHQVPGVELKWISAEADSACYLFFEASEDTTFSTLLKWWPGHIEPLHQEIPGRFLDAVQVDGTVTLFTRQQYLLDCLRIEWDGVRNWELRRIWRTGLRNRAASALPEYGAAVYHMRNTLFLDDGNQFLWPSYTRNTWKHQQPYTIWSITEPDTLVDSTALLW